jgi:hypothetical protein
MCLKAEFSMPVIAYIFTVTPNITTLWLLVGDQREPTFAIGVFNRIIKQSKLCCQF